MRNAMILWGKTDRNDSTRFHPLLCHLLDTAAVAEALLPRFGNGFETPTPWVLYLCAIHDIGKVDPEFQCKAPQLRGLLLEAGWDVPSYREGFRHEGRSAEWIAQSLRTLGSDADSRIVIRQAITGHHGRFRTETPLDEDPIWRDARDAVACEVSRILDLPAGAPPPIRNASAEGVRLTGLIVLADWIASNDELFRYSGIGITVPLDRYFDFAREEAARAVSRLAFNTEATTSTSPPSFAQVWPGRMPRASQAAAERLCGGGLPPGLAIIEAPTGEGKTEAAIYMAECWNRALNRSGLYIALPTQATSNQIHRRYAEHLRSTSPDRTPPRLIHGMAWLLDDDVPEATSQIDGETGDEERSLDWFRNQKRALLATEGVGTVDQALIAALNVKHGFLRLLGLTGKVLIIDEVHAYDEYMTTIMERLLQWCATLRVPVILLSATLSKRQKLRLLEAYGGANASLGAASPEAYPLITVVPLDGIPMIEPVEPDPSRDRTITVEKHFGLLDDAEATAQLAIDATRNGGCACVLVNTVGAAQATYEAIRAHGEEDAYLFHARFPAGRRDDIEREITGLFGPNAGESGRPARPLRAIVVGTQVLEQSLDIDFDVMISQIAPVDLLLQRAGRLHRHARGPRQTGPAAVLHILLPPDESLDFGSTAWVYMRLPLLRTMAALHTRSHIKLPADYRVLIESVYGDPEIPATIISAEELNSAEAEWRADAAAAEHEAAEHLLPSPDPIVFSIAELAQRPVEEDEDGGRQDYFHARTRRGEETLTVLVLEEPDLISATRANAAPHRDQLRLLFRQKAGIPNWWLIGLNPAEGYEVPFVGPRWLRGAWVLPLQGGEWRGYDAGDRQVTIRNDVQLGLSRQTTSQKRR